MTPASVIGDGIRDTIDGRDCDRHMVSQSTKLSYRSGGGIP